ncbi:unnamed protein product [Symbiodinium sp. CCMP2592]|nr:unnamed protein product [Symbiodinium sp. CCMP2592]
MQRDSSFRLTVLQFGPRIFGGLDGTSRDIGPDNFNQGKPDVNLDVPLTSDLVDIEVPLFSWLGKYGYRPRSWPPTFELHFNQVLIINNTAWLIATSTMMTIH